MWNHLVFFVVLANALAEDTVPVGLPSEETPDRRAVMERLRAYRAFQSEKANLRVKESKSSEEMRDPSEFLFEGDMVFTPQQIESLLSHRQKRQITTYQPFKWSTTQPIPYKFTQGIHNSTRVLIRKAFQFWQDHTCLRFNETNGSDGLGHFINFINLRKKCKGFVGKVTDSGGSVDLTAGENWQDLSIGEGGCEHFGTITHEIGHALGFFHTQTRQDRDGSVIIFKKKIDAKAYEFNYVLENATATYKVSYDYGSIMHYAEDYFNVWRNRTIVMRAQDPRHQQTMGQNIKPSFHDILMTNNHYQCRDRCSNSKTVCHRGGYPNPRDCSKCICPWGLTSDCLSRDLGKNVTARCGGILYAHNDTQHLEIKMRYDGSLTDVHDECHWHIHIKVENFGHDCDAGCPFANIEVKTGKIDRQTGTLDMSESGYRMCCNDRTERFIRTQTVMRSVAFLAQVSAYARMPANFAIAYRSVDPENPTPWH